MTSGAATRTRPSGGYTPRCKFLMSLRTTSTAMPLTAMRFTAAGCASIVMLLLLCQFEDAVGLFFQVQWRSDSRTPLINPPQPGICRYRRGQHMPYCQPDLFDLHGVVAPASLQAGLDGCINGHGQIGQL